MAKGIVRLLVFVCLACVPHLRLAAQSTTVGLRRFSNAALISCFSDHRCGEDYWVVSSELAHRRPTDFLMASYWKTANPQQRYGIILALHEIDSPQVARFMRMAIARKAIPDTDGLYCANDYLASRCDSRALRFLIGNGQLEACPEWARTVSYFGKCLFRPAAQFLLKSLDSQCLDIGNAAADSLTRLFPDAPKSFANVAAMKEYFAGRIKAER